MQNYIIFAPHVVRRGIILICMTLISDIDRKSNLKTTKCQCEDLTIPKALLNILRPVCSS